MDLSRSLVPFIVVADDISVSGASSIYRRCDLRPTTSLLIIGNAVSCLASTEALTRDELSAKIDSREESLRKTS